MSGTCPSCGCSQPNGLLCSEDTAAVEIMLAAAPQLIEQLDVAVSKQARLSAGGKAGKGTAREKSPVNWGVAAVRDSLLIELALWGDDINEIRQHPQAAEIASGIGHAIKRAYSAIDRVRDRKYLGRCNNQQTCPAEIWAKPGASQVQCDLCKYVHDVSVRRADLMVVAKDLIVTPREASRYIGEYGDMEVGHQRIRNYLDRKRIPLRPSPDDVQRFRFGDLLDLLKKDAARHDAQAS